MKGTLTSVAYVLPGYSVLCAQPATLHPSVDSSPTDLLGNDPDSLHERQAGPAKHGLVCLLINNKGLR